MRTKVQIKVTIPSAQKNPSTAEVMKELVSSLKKDGYDVIDARVIDSSIAWVGEYWGGSMTFEVVFEGEVKIREGDTLNYPTVRGAPLILAEIIAALIAIVIATHAVAKVIKVVRESSSELVDILKWLVPASLAIAVMVWVIKR